MSRAIRKTLLTAAAIAISSLFGSVASAELVLSQTIIDLVSGKPPREDVEVFNAGSERMYVLAEPFEIIGAGTPQERREAVDLSQESSLLVSPLRTVLEPGERRTIRIGFVGNRPSSDRVYRVAIRPVAGALTSDTNALKLFVGYDALVLVRPELMVDDIKAERTGSLLALRNDGNTAQEVFEGKQCAGDGTACKLLPATRLYPGTVWKQELPYDTDVTYKTAIASSVVERRY